ncbi:hypothetical protein [Lysobacter capsici]|uniref:hypothetical protein n=1 Tax=Lysobacter capsici TaxID=435897 RepID=UPI0009E861FF|nr:hypothetical protein [Lysobacter capsici]
MNRVIILGWVPGFNKIEANKQLRTYLGYDLREAKDMVDAIVRGDAVEFFLPADKSVEICMQLERIGALCRQVPSEDNS